jgi:phage tail sheath protein FI
VLDVPAIVSWRRRFDSTFAAMYAPWVSVVDPLSRAGRLRRVPPSGHVAGLMARIDTEAGPWLSPANRLLRWVHAADTALDDTWHGVLNDADVDALRAQPGRGVAVLGARTVASDESWRFVSTRRLFLMVERTLRVGLAWTVFEPAGPSLDRVMAAVITGLLEDLWERGAFDGESPQDAFFVKTGEGDRARGEVIVEVGIAIARPAEVILLQVVRTQDRLEIREQPERSF